MNQHRGLGVVLTCILCINIFLGTSHLVWAFDSEQEPYSITINYISVKTGEIIKSQDIEVSVDGYLMEKLPSQFFEGDVEYVLDPESRTTVVHCYGDDARTYDISYFECQLEPDGEPFNVSVYLMDLHSASCLMTINGTVSPEKDYVYDSNEHEMLEVDGRSYELVDTDTVLTYSYDGAVSKGYVYYTEVAKDPYTVTLNRIDETTGKVLSSEEKNVTDGGYVFFENAKQLEVEEHLYKIVEGQEYVIVHNYEDTKRTYAVYYKAENEKTEETSKTPETQVNQNKSDDNQKDVIAKETEVKMSETVQKTEEAEETETEFKEEIQDDLVVEIAFENISETEVHLESEEMNAVPTVQNDITIADETVPLANVNLEDETEENTNRSLGVIIGILLLIGGMGIIFIKKDKIMH